MTSATQKNITAIMFTDIVGYSKMAAKDEKLALELLEKHNNIIFPIIKKCSGSIIKLIGDAIFAKFKSSEDSVACAISIQQSLREKNKLSSKKERIQIRIGLHAGHVIEKDNDLFGNDVNLGSRIENVAQPGCIAASKELFDSIENARKILHRTIGHVKLKNIPEPKLLIKIYLDQLDYNNESETDIHQAFKEKGVQIVDINTYEVQKVVPIGVLYVNNLGSKDDEYFCHNFTHDIIKNLQSVNSLRVPSLNEAVRMKNSDLPLSEVARKLRVDVLLNGSILKKNNEVVVSFDMISANSGETIWQKTWETDGSKIEQIKNQVIIEILELNEVDVPEKIKQEFGVLSSNVPKANDEYQKARFLIDHIKSKNDLMLAKEHLENAVKHDPNFLYAQAQIGWINHRLGYFEDAEEQLLYSMQLADGDGTLYSNNYVYHQLGILYNAWGKHKKSILNHKKALEMQVLKDDLLNRSVFMHNLATSYKNDGQYDKAIDYYNESLKIKIEYENRPLQATTLAQIGQIYHETGYPSQALNNLKNALGIFQDYSLEFMVNKALLVIAQIYVKLGFYDRAEDLLKEGEAHLNEFEDASIAGHIKVCQGIIEFQKNKISSSISTIQNGIDQFQIAQKQSTAFEFSLLLIRMLIFSKRYDEAKQALEKISLLSKQIKHSDSLVLFQSMNLCIDAINNKKAFTTNEVLSLESDEINAETLCHVWWNLGLGYASLEDTKQAEICLSKSKTFLDKAADKIENKTHKESYLKNDVFNQIIVNANPKSLLLMFKNPEISVSKFCSSCGYNNQGLKPFCPECGNSLSLSH